MRGKYYVLGEKASATEDLKETMKTCMKKFDEGFENWKNLKDTFYELKDDGDFFQVFLPIWFEKVLL